jgi:hypothetical protein
MGFRPCMTRDDPFTKQVRQTYRAAVVLAPRTGIEPLDALAVDKDRRVHERGRLANLIAGEVPALPQPRSEEVADLNGLRSAAVDVGLGAELSANFLAALGMPLPSASLEASLWKGASKLMFEIREVTQHNVDISQLGRDLEGRRIQRNATTDLFFTSSTTNLHIITRTLTSATFAVTATSSKGQSFQVGVDGLADVLGQAHGRVSWNVEQQSTLSFHGDKPATFAFSAVPCGVFEGGTFVFGLESADLTFGTRQEVDLSPRPIVDEPGLLFFDDEPD